MPVVQTRLRSLTFAETVPVFVKSACCLLCASVRSSAWCRASAVRWQSSPNFACPAFLLSSATQCNGKIKTPLYVAFHKKHIHCLVIWRTFNQLRLAIIINGFLPKNSLRHIFPIISCCILFPSDSLDHPFDRNGPFHTSDSVWQWAVSEGRWESSPHQIRRQRCFLDSNLWPQLSQQRRIPFSIRQPPLTHCPVIVRSTRGWNYPQNIHQS